MTTLTLEQKAILTAPIGSDSLGRVAPGPVLPLRLRSLIPPGTVTGQSITYLRETSITSSPVAPVAPGALKPQADLTYESQERPVTTIPAYIKASRQAWEDSAMFQSWINARMLYALMQAEEKQLLNGNGVAPQLEGLMMVALPAAAGATTSLLDNVGAGIAALYGLGYIADGIVLNPANVGKSLNLLGSPALIQAPLNLWGVPVVLSPAMASGSYLVGQFNPYCQIFDRQLPVVDAADENQDDFVRNMVTIRAEERIAFAIYQPGAFAKGTFTP
jgi:Phage capsid family